MSQVNWVDSIKGIGIILVVLGHISSPFTEFIYSFHMPLFFIISGFFIKPSNDLKIEVLQSIKKIFTPFIIYLAIGFFVEFIKRFYLNRDQIIIEDLINALIFMDYSNLEGTYAFVLWFFPALFIGRLVVLTILKYQNTIFLRLLSVLIIFLIGFYFNFPFAIDDGFISVPFIFLGYYLFNNHNFFFSKKASFFLIIILALIFIFNGLPHLNQSTKFFDSVLINFLWACSISILLFTVFNFYNYKIRGISFIGSNSLPIFLWHPYTNNVAHFMSENYIIKFAISFFLCLILIYTKGFIAKKIKNG